MKKDRFEQKQYMVICRAAFRGYRQVDQ